MVKMVKCITILNKINLHMHFKNKNSLAVVRINKSINQSAFVFLEIGSFQFPVFYRNAQLSSAPPQNIQRLQWS